MMKKMTALFVAALLVVSVCPVMAETTEQISIVCTIFPPYDWVREILGQDAENVKLTLLMDDGADLHNYQPSVSDITAIRESDLFLYVGGESDGWVADVLAAAPDVRALSLLSAVEAKAETLLEGMEAEHDHDHEEADDHEEAEDHDHDHEEEEYDEHVWLSLRYAKTLTEKICAELSALRPEQAALYAQNAKAYQQALDTLDQAYAEAVAGAQIKTLLFADRFPFRYLADDYGLSCYAAFAGCSAETEASFATLLFLVSKVNELHLPAVMTLEGSDGAMARTVVENSAEKNQEIIVLDSCQSVNAERIGQGETYLSIMQENLSALTRALGQ